MERTDMPGLLGMLQERGYEWQDEPYADVFDLTASAGSVRVVSYRDSEPSLRVVAMDSREAHRWSVRVEPDVPFNVVVALIGAAEDELSAIAGRNVTGEGSVNAGLEELAEQVVKVAWSQFTSEIATCYAENTSSGDDTPQRWAQLRTIAFQRMAAKTAAEQAARATS